jgi:hypothetical protein
MCVCACVYTPLVHGCDTSKHELSFSGKLKLPSEGEGQYYVYFHSSWRLDAGVAGDVRLLP